MTHLINTAKNLPLAFAQVREDSLLDVQIIQKLGSDLSVLMVASGGCTAAFLATCPNVSRIHIVDINPSQIALCKLKLKILQECSLKERLEILGHINIDAVTRKKLLQEHLKELNYTEDVFGPIDQVSKNGPDYMGRYEYVFAALQEQLEKHLESLCFLIYNDCIPNKEIIIELHNALKNVLTKPSLVALFGNDATQNAIKPFSDHFFEQTLMIMKNTQLASSKNPYLQQMLLGKFKENVYYPWLTQVPNSNIPEIHYSQSNMLEILKKSNDKYHFIHLSNITDWLDEKQVYTLLKHTVNCLHKGGCVFIRQLNSNLNIPKLCNALIWDETFANHLLNQDRSFFYLKLYIGIKE